MEMIHSEQPRSQALSSMRRRGGKTLVGAGHVIGLGKSLILHFLSVFLYAKLDIPTFGMLFKLDPNFSEGL